MSEHAVSGTVDGSGGVTAAAAGSTAYGAGEAHHHGKPLSWIAIAIIAIGFILGGAALVPSPTWWLFWLAVGIVTVGCVVTLFAKTFSEDWY